MNVSIDNSSGFCWGVVRTVQIAEDQLEATRAERNTYVRAMIAFEREKRDFTLFEDEITLTVRSEYRILEQEIIERDASDSSRDVSPLTKASDATEIDTTLLSIDEQVEKIVSLAQAYIKTDSLISQYLKF